MRKPIIPARVVKLIVPYPPGGGTDLLARVLADQLGRKWGQAVIVENIGGAGGNIGAAEVFRADPDGYTLLLASPGPIATNAYMYKDMSYDPAKWVPIAVLATSPYVLVLSNGFDSPNLPLLLTHAKANPGRLTAATPGVGSVGQLATIELEMLADIKLLQVPYKGLSPAVADVLAGNVNMMFDMLATSLPLYRAQKEKIIAVGSTERVKELPDVPTIAEAGVPGYRAVTFFGIVAPPAHARRTRRQDQPRRGRLPERPRVHRKDQSARHGSGARQPRRRGKILRRRARAVGQSDQASRHSVAVSRTTGEDQWDISPTENGPTKISSPITTREGSTTSVPPSSVITSATRRTPNFPPSPAAITSTAPSPARGRIAPR